MVELLVVIAIIAVLAGLLLPALGSAKTRAQGVRCLGNLGQLQLGFALYTTDHGGTMPLNIVGWRQDRPSALTGSWVEGNARFEADPATVQRGSLFPFLAAVEPYRCPGDRATVRGPTGKALPRVRSYSMAMTLNGRFEGAGPPHYGVGGGVHLQGAEAAVPRPSQTYVFVGLTGETIDAGAIYFSLTDFGDAASAYGMAWNHLPSDRHGGTGTLSFFDGHVESRHWRQQPKRGRPNQSPFANEPDREDARWLLRRSPWYHLTRDR